MRAIAMFKHLIAAALPALLLAAFVVSTGTMAAEPYRAPVIDAHNHIGGSFDPETMVRAMRANGVRAMVLMARNYPGPAGRRDLPGNDKMADPRRPALFFRVVASDSRQRPHAGSSGTGGWKDSNTRVNSLSRQNN
jgi:hypothetical protein